MQWQTKVAVVDGTFVGSVEVRQSDIEATSMGIPKMGQSYKGWYL